MSSSKLYERDLAASRCREGFTRNTAQLLVSLEFIVHVAATSTSYSVPEIRTRFLDQNERTWLSQLCAKLGRVYSSWSLFSDLAHWSRPVIACEQGTIYSACQVISAGVASNFAPPLSMCQPNWESPAECSRTHLQLTNQCCYQLRLQQDDEGWCRGS